MTPSALPQPLTFSEPDLAARAAFWKLPPPSFNPEQYQLMRSTCLTLNWGGFGLRLDELDVNLMVERLGALGTKLGPNLASLRFLALARIPAEGYREQPLCKRNNDGSYYFLGYSDADVDTPKESIFDFKKPTVHLGLAFLLAKKSQLTRALLKFGCHPALMFTSGWDGAGLPSPDQFCDILIESSLHSSEQPCTALFTAASEQCLDPKILISALHTRTRALLTDIWTSRSGVVNQADLIAAQKARFAFALLARHQTLPDDLCAANQAVLQKLASAALAKPTRIWDASPEMSARMRGLSAIAQGDDLLGFAALAPLCGALDDGFFDAGIPQGLDIGYTREKPYRYWSTCLASVESWHCAAHMLDLGDNAWLCAGDGSDSFAADANPFSRLVDWGSTIQNEAGFSNFAHAWIRATLRDAESRAPGFGRARCLAALDASRARVPHLWTSDASPVSLAACESAVLILASGSPMVPDTETPPIPAPRRVRL